MVIGDIVALLGGQAQRNF